MEGNDALHLKVSYLVKMAVWLEDGWGLLKTPPVLDRRGEAGGSSGRHPSACRSASVSGLHCMIGLKLEGVIWRAISSTPGLVFNLTYLILFLSSCEFVYRRFIAECSLRSVGLTASRVVVSPPAGKISLQSIWEFENCNREPARQPSAPLSAA